MESAKTSKLDIEKFRKVYALMKRGATEGERSAAKTRATAMATAAGLSLERAVSMLDASPPQQQPFSIFHGFDDWMEEREPGYKAKKATQRAERENRNQERRDRVLQQYGSVEALLARTPLEQALFDAARPFGKVKRYRDGRGGTHEYFTELGGMSSEIDPADKANPEAVAAIRAAHPIPATLDGCLDEIRMWDQLRWDRGLFIDSGEWVDGFEVEIRRHLVEKELNERPVANWHDMEARFSWKRFEYSRQWIDFTGRNDPTLDRIELDFAILRKLGEVDAANVQNGRRTNAGKRADVMSILDREPGLSDREIARRVGVSPQTVGNWRRRMAA